MARTLIEVSSVMFATWLLLLGVDSSEKERLHLYADLRLLRESCAWLQLELVRLGRDIRNHRDKAHWLVCEIAWVGWNFVGSCLRRNWELRKEIRRMYA